MGALAKEVGMQLGQALAGVRVVEVAMYIPGPVCTQILAGLGAQVTKVERPGGDPLRHMVGLEQMFAPLNADKTFVELDLKTHAGQAALRELALGADVLVDGLRPGALERLGLGAAALAEGNLRLIYCAISGYGLRGPDREHAGHDLNFVALSGLIASTHVAGTPALPGAPLADMISGMTAATAILAALQARERTGIGGVLDVPMAAAAAWLMAPWHAVARAGAPVSDTLTGGQACYRLYRCADSRYLAVAALEPHFWERFCTAIGRPELIPLHMATGAAQVDLQTAVAATIAERTLAEWEAVFAHVDACVTPVRTVEEAAEQSRPGVNLPV
jgi:crotonobetainyl-CoA:carnitine CoA-transferase CaiB-like acyl-CoA transferase